MKAKQEREGGILAENKPDSVYAQAKRILDELDPRGQTHVIKSLNEDEIRAWFLLTYKKGQST